MQEILPPCSLPASLGIDLIELETFIAVARAGSFSVAAQALHVAQPSVTGRVQRLETFLGVKLLARTTRKVETTPDGQRLLLEATSALGGLRNVVEGFRQKARLTRQQVVIASTPMLSALSLPPLIQAYSARFTDVQVEVLDLQYADALAALNTGLADFAVLSLEDRDERYRFQALWTDDMVLVVPTKHVLAVRDGIELAQLTGHRLTIVSQHEPMALRIGEAMKARGLAMTPVRTVANLNTLLGMLEAGLGIMLLPRSMARRNAAYVVVDVKGITLRRSYGIAIPHRAKLSAAAHSFCRFLQQEMASRT